MLSYNTSGSKSIVNFEEIHGGNKSNVAVCRQSDKDENGEEDLDSFLHQTEKKRRLTVNQVQNLEKSFEVENKLEPERKFELAKELGLQPRQVAIWFQNRRARFKTKQLEKDYDSLKASYNCLRADYDSIVTENEKLKTEVQLLTDRLHLIEKEKMDLEPFDSSSPLNTAAETPFPKTVSNHKTDIQMVVCKQEDASSSKSDVVDSDSPHCTDGNDHSILEMGDSLHGIRVEHLDFSRKSVLLPLAYNLPKLEDCTVSGSCNFEIPGEPCSFETAVEDQHVWFWTS